jgi:hypothetical protein
MPTRFFGQEITDHLKNLLESALTPDNITNGGLGLAFVQRGGLEYFPAPSIAHVLPAIFLKLMNIQTVLGQPFHRIDQVYSFRLVYLREYTEEEFAVNTKYRDASLIANIIYDNFTLPAIPPLAAGTLVKFCNVDSIEFEPPEDDIAVLSGDNISALAINVSVHLRVSRENV